MPYPPNSTGYSLYELLMTLGLVSIVLTLGLPSFGKIVANHRVRVDVDGLFHAIHLARKTSVVRRRAITICPTLDFRACDRGNDWSKGWILFSNKDRDWPAVRDADEPIIKVGQVHPRNRIVANRRSFSLRGTELRATNGTLIFCDRGGKATPRALVISYTGRPRVAYRNRRGNPYQCPD